MLGSEGYFSAPGMDQATRRECSIRLYNKVNRTRPGLASSVGSCAAITAESRSRSEPGKGITFQVFFLAEQEVRHCAGAESKLAGRRSNRSKMKDCGLPSYRSRSSHPHDRRQLLAARRLDTARFPAESTLLPDRARTCRQAGAVAAARQALRGARLALAHGLEGSLANHGHAPAFRRSGPEAGFAMHRFHMRTCGGTRAPVPYSVPRRAHFRPARSCSRAVRTRGRGRRSFWLASPGRQRSAQACRRAGPSAAASSPTSAPAPLPSIWRPAPDGSAGSTTYRVYDAASCAACAQRLIATGRLPAGRFPRASALSSKSTTRSPRHPSVSRRRSHYYATQSANQFLRADPVVPTLIVQAQDDTFIPFEIFERRNSLQSNLHASFARPDHGGHLGFISREQAALLAGQT